MAKRPSKAPTKPGTAAQPPAPVNRRDEMYGPGATPTLYSGAPSILAPVEYAIPAVNTASGQNSPSAAMAANGPAMSANTEASLLPAGQNPMTVYALVNRKFPINGGSQQ